MDLLFVNWATIQVKVKSSQMAPLPRGHKMQGNTPDLMLEHFIVHLLVVQDGPLQWEGRV